MIKTGKILTESMRVLLVDDHPLILNSITSLLMACNIKVVGEASDGLEALEKAVMRRFGGKVPEGHQLTLRVDRGSQFRAHRFRETARLLNVRLEYAGIKCPEDKPYIESFNSSYKTEEIYRNEYRSFQEAKTCLGGLS